MVDYTQETKTDVKTEVKPVNTKKIEEPIHEEEENFDAKAAGDLNLEMMSKTCKEYLDAYKKVYPTPELHKMQMVSDPETGIMLMYMPGSYPKLDAEGNVVKAANGYAERVSHYGLPGSFMFRPKSFTPDQLLLFSEAMARFKKTMAPAIRYEYMLSRDITQRKLDNNLLEA
ncbi:MAG TPA: hypothetical protein DCG34_08890 [Clostridiales bacterium]|jgi:hypothetical protein|nr:hypothetical protein [Clostridiales bacterium]